MSTETETAIDKSYATQPFDSDDADFILISSDGMFFFVHTYILSLSPVFSNMFLFDEDTRLGPSDGCPPIVRLTEDSTTLDTFLRIVYPVESPELGLDEVKHLLEVSQKYQSTTAIVHLSLLLHVFLDVDPYTVFAIACLYDLETVARAAAQRVTCFVSSPLVRSPPYAPEMKDISAGSYFRLLWHIGRHRAGITVDENYWSSFSFVRRNPGDGIPLAEDTHTACTTNKQISEWKDFGLFLGSVTDIILCSSDGVQFPVHKFILSIMHSLPAESDTTKWSSSYDTPVLEVPEDSHLLNLLLRSCYYNSLQTTSPDFPLDMSQFTPFVRAALKYEMEGSIACARLQFHEIFKTNPVRGYFVAISFGWTDEASTAAFHVAMGTADVERTYVSEMEVVDAEAYFNLLRYRTSVQAAIVGGSARHWSRRELEERYYPKVDYKALVKKNIQLHISVLKQQMNIRYWWVKRLETEFVWVPAVFLSNLLEKCRNTVNAIVVAVSRIKLPLS